MNPHQPKAEYDDEGNIILPSETRMDDWTVTDQDNMPIANIEEESVRVSRHQHVQTIPHQEQWELTDDDPEKKQPGIAVLQHVRAKLLGVSRSLYTEGKDQYNWSIDSCRNQCTTLMQSTLSKKGSLWRFLSQPVWVVNEKKQQMKEYSRLTLFLIDTIRFGGTFAVLFLGLFISFNYESFWKIAESHVNPIRRVQQSMMNGGVDSDMKKKLLKSPSLAVAGSNNGDLLGFLPPVGPPRNLIVIPKLALTAPLITPSYQSLLDERWNDLENDIQDALQYGVVHYPGTARPGQAGNFFVTGHSSYYFWKEGDYKTIFARLHELEVGDEYWVYYGGDKHRYIVQEKKEVKPSNVDVLDQPVSKRISTLMTCTPVGTTLRRLIITAQEVDPSTGIALDVGEQQERIISDIKLETLPI